MRGSARGSQQSTQDSPQETVVGEVMSDRELGESPAQEVMRRRTFSDSELSDIDSWESVLEKATAAYGGIVSVTDVLGTGFAVATEDDKERLCGVPLLILEWSFNAGDFSEDYVSCVAVQRLDDGGIKKWIINDGGQGIRKQLTEYQSKTGNTGGLAVPKGLRVSKFYIDAETKLPLTKSEVAEAISSKRKIQPAHTFYLDTSA
jgi:hypothetical protein